MNTTIAIRSIASLLALLALLPLAARAGDATPAPIANTEGSSRVVAVSTGEFHSCALAADGRAVCWGYNNWGQLYEPPSEEVPPGNLAGPSMSIATGGLVSCGLKATGHVSCWGYRSNIFELYFMNSEPFVAVSAGDVHACGLKADGSVTCSGDNAYGQLTGTPSTSIVGTLAGPYLAISANGSHTCGLKAEGSVDCWGYNGFGELNGTPDTAVHAGSVAGPFVAVSAGSFHTCGLKSDGSVDCWGNNDRGQANAPAGPFVSVSAGLIHTCGLKADGSVACWGGGGGLDYGQSAAPAGSFVSVSAGSYHSCGLKTDGSVACWGAGGPGTSGGGNFGQSTVPADLQGPAGFGQIAAGNAHACEVKRDGTLACWGDNSEGQTNAPAGLFTQVVAGSGHGCAIRADGTATCWGRPSSTFINSVFDDFSPYRQLALGTQHAVCALAAGAGQGQESLCVNEGIGDHSDGVMARNITSDYSSSLSPFATSSLCAVTPDGEGHCRTASGAASPADAAIPPGPWQRLESGLGHACGLKVDGTLACWGDNSEGQTNNVPTGLFRAFSVGWNHACAIRDTGNLACWGSNINGQASPPGGAFVQVAAGNTFTCGIRDIGIRVCWGTGPGVPVSLSPGSLPNGTPGVPYAIQFSLAGDAANLPANPVYGASSGNFPPGLDLNAGGLLSGTPTVAGTFTLVVDAEGDGDFGTSREYSITISDGTPPVITYTLDPDPADGDNGWYTGNVTVTWLVTDPDSGATIDSGCGTNLVDTLNADTSPAGATFSCSAHSAGGSATTSVTLKRDGTDPTISIAPASTANDNGWHRADVGVLTSCGDPTPGSGVASCPSVPDVTAEGSTTVPAQTVRDNAGNTGSSNPLTIKIDKTAPTVSAAATNAPDGSNGWYVSDVGVAFTCNDATSGIASCPADQTLSTEGSSVSSSAQTATDNAGNSSDPSNIVTVKIDKTAPTLAPTVPDPLLRDGTYSASPNASDAVSGVASASCGPLDTSSLGSFSTTCSATDNAGNSRTVALDYTISTTCANDGYKGTQLTWCKNICENGLTGAVLDTWIHRWVQRYRELPYCRAEAD